MSFFGTGLEWGGGKTNCTPNQSPAKMGRNQEGKGSALLADIFLPFSGETGFRKSEPARSTAGGEIVVSNPGALREKSAQLDTRTFAVHNIDNSNNHFISEYPKKVGGGGIFPPFNFETQAPEMKYNTVSSVARPSPLSSALPLDPHTPQVRQVAKFF